MWMEARRPRVHNAVCPGTPPPGSFRPHDSPGPEPHWFSQRKVRHNSVSVCVEPSTHTLILQNPLA